MNFRTSVSSASLIASLLLFGGAANAQTDAGAQQDAGGLDEIVVTAQRRSEKLQEVPLTIAAVTSENLTRAGVASVRDLQTLVSGLTFGGTGNLAAPAIRGVSSTVTVAGTENGNALYIDGVYQSAQVLLNAEFPDVERIEVLKGPQGTLFGRNAIGGAIRVITQAPSFTPTMRVSLEAGQYLGSGSSRSAPHLNAKAYVSGPIVADLLAASVSGGINYTPGFQTRVSTGQRVGEISRKNIRAKLLFTPAANATLTLAGHYVTNNTPGELLGTPFKGMTAARFYPGSVIPTKPWQTDYNDDPFSSPLSVRLRDHGISGTVKLDFDAGTLTSISAYNLTRNKQSTSIHGANGTFACLINSACIGFVYQIRQRVYQEDLNFSSREFGIFSFTAGAFYYNSKTNTLNFSGGPLQPFIPGAPFLTQDNQAKTKAYAAYGEVTVKPTDRLSLIAGVRQSHEVKNDVAALPTAGPIKKTFNATTPRFSVKYEVTPQLNAYATYSVGYKSGLSGVTNPGSIPPFAPVKPERLNAAEIGLKFASSDLTANLSGFYYDYKNKQESVNRGAGGQVVVQNTGPVKMYGLDFDANARITREFSVRGGLTWIPKAEYRDFPDAVGTSTATVPFDPTQPPFNCAPFGLCGTYIPGTLVATGTRLLRAPKLSANGTIAFDNDSFDASATLSYSSAVRNDLFGIQTQSAYALLSAQAGYTFDGIRVGIYGRNLTNKAFILANLTSLSGFATIYNQPREVGVSVSYSF